MRKYSVRYRQLISPDNFSLETLKALLIHKTMFCPYLTKGINPLRRASTELSD